MISSFLNPACFFFSPDTQTSDVESVLPRLPRLPHPVFLCFTKTGQRVALRAWRSARGAAGGAPPGVHRSGAEEDLPRDLDERPGGVGSPSDLDKA